jgi:hypothetical protein
MTDDTADIKEIKEDEIELESTHHEPDFAPVAVAPVFDDAEDEDPHAEPFHKVEVAAESSFTDPYGVGAPNAHDDEYGLDDDEEDEPSYLMSDTDSY